MSLAAPWLRGAPGVGAGRVSRRRVAAVAVLLAAAPVVGVRADAVAALRARLAAQAPQTAFAGRVQLHSTTTRSGDDATAPVRASLQVQVRDGPQGTGVDATAAELARLQRDGDRHGKRNGGGASDLMNRINPAWASELVDFAPALLRRLDGARLRSQRDTRHDGRPVHELVFDVPSQLDPSQQKAVKHYEGRLTLWLDAGGQPVALREKRRYEGRKFFIHFEFDASEQATLERIGKRLVVLRRHSEQGGEGMGQHSRTVVDAVLTPGD